MAKTYDGGPAFPTGDNPESRLMADPGMSLRDFFIAHAPAEPQSWFKPVMEPEPKSVQFPADMTQEERAEYHGWDEYLATSDLKYPRIRAYAESVDAYTVLRRAWNSEYEKQRYVQWPVAWADAMIAARSA